MKKILLFLLLAVNLSNAQKFNLEIDGKIKSTTVGNVDWYYGGGNPAWSDTASALAGVPSAVRSGRTVGILVGGEVVEYWWKSGILDEDLVLKIADTTAPTLQAVLDAGNVAKGTPLYILNSSETSETGLNFGNVTLQDYVNGDYSVFSKTNLEFSNNGGGEFTLYNKGFILSGNTDSSISNRLILNGRTASGNAVFNFNPTKPAGSYVLTTSDDFKTINGESIVGSGNIEISTGTGTTDLGYTPSPTNGTVTSSTGDDAVIPLADSTNAGLLSPDEKVLIGTALQSGSPISDLTNDSDVVGESGADALNTLLDTKIETSEKGVANGVASLDSSGKVPLSQLNDAILGNLKWYGLYDGSVISSSPVTSLNGAILPTASTTNVGWYFISSTNYMQGGINFVTGDWIISNGVDWGKVDNTDAVSTVFGRVGNVVATTGDYSANQVTNNSTVAGAVVSEALSSLNSLKENISNKSDSYTASSSTTYTSTKALVDGLATKQNTLTNPVTGVVGSGFLPVGTGSNVLGNSQISQSGTRVSVGSGTSLNKLTINQDVSSEGILLKSAISGFANIDIESNRTSGNLGGFRFVRTGLTFPVAELKSNANGTISLAFGNGSSVATESTFFDSTGTTTPSLILSTTPTTSAGSYRMITQNTSTGKFESLPSTTFQPTITATTTADYFRGDKTFQPLNKTAVGLSNVDNTSDPNKPVSTATQTALDGKENAFSKNTAFNKDFGTTSGTVADGGTTQTALNSKQATLTAGTNITITGNTISATSTDSRPYLSYMANVTQTGTSDPVVTEFENNTGMTFTWVRDTAGQYHADVAGGTFPDQIWTSASNHDSTGHTGFYKLDSDTLFYETISTTTGLPIDEATTSIEVRIPIFP